MCTPWMGVSSSLLVVLAPLGSAQPSSYIHQAYISDSSLGAGGLWLGGGEGAVLACSGGLLATRLAFCDRHLGTTYSPASFYLQEQYRLCYELALSYLNSFETYGNFK